MKKILCCWLSLLAACCCVRAQDTAAARVGSWTFSATSRGNGEYVIDAKAALRKGWRLFSVAMPDSLPNSRIALDSGAGGVALGASDGPGVVHGVEKLLDYAPISYFKDSAHFLLTIRVTPGQQAPVKGSVHLMAIL